MDNVTDLIATADKYMAAGDTTSALKIWEKIVSQKPTAKAHLRMGEIAEEAGLWSDAQQAYEKASIIASNSPMPFIGLGVLAITRTDIPRNAALAQAKSWLLESARKKETAIAFSILGSVEIELGDEMAARAAFEHALELDPAYTEAILHLAELEKATAPDRAKRLLEKALGIDPENGPAHQEYGRLLQKEGRLYDAILGACRS